MLRYICTAFQLDGGTRKYAAFALLPVLAALGAGIFQARGQDDVTIPKSRLEELERKEKELEKLRGQGQQPGVQSNAPVKLSPDDSPAHLTPAATSPAPAPGTPPAPGMDTLPPFQDDQTVEATDLAAHFQADHATAGRRYDKHKLTVRGEIAAFEKPLLSRNYHVVLRTPDREARIICNFYPPDKFNAVFTSEHGGALVALAGERRVPLAKTGDIVLVHGICRGWHDGVVMISAGEMHRAP